MTKPVFRVEEEEEGRLTLLCREYGGNPDVEVLMFTATKGYIEGYLGAMLDRDPNNDNETWGLEEEEARQELWAALNG